MNPDYRYPIGHFHPPAEFSREIIAQYISEIGSLPERLEKVVAPLSEAMLDTPYRADGWTVRQVVHHLADSHQNGYIRHSLTLTENEPTIKPYLEQEWAKLPDALSAPVELSVSILKALHARWVYMLTRLPEDQFGRTYLHPEKNQVFTLAESCGLYAWHGNHHLAHITGLIDRTVA